MNERVYNIREVSSVRDLVETSCELYAQRPAFMWEKDGAIHSIDYKTVGEDVRSLATELTSQGYEGRIIAVYGENCYQWAITYLAVCSGVGIIMPIDRDYKEEQLSFVMNDSGADLLIYSDSLEKVVVNSGLKAQTIPFSAVEGMIESGRNRIARGDESYSDYIVDPFGFGILLYTSGTMGTAKGVMLSQYNVCSNLMQALRLIRVTEQDRALSVLPLHHTYECTVGFLALFFSGASIAYNRSLRTLMSDMRRFSPTIMIVVPMLMNAFYKQILKKYDNIKVGKAIYATQKLLSKGISPKLRKKVFTTINSVFGGNIRAFVCGAAPLSADVFNAFTSYGFSVYVGYGLTETSPICLMHNDEYRCAEDVGLPIAGVRVRIVDPDEHGIGELAVRGNNVMLGYFHNPEETEKVIKNGWLYTGDYAQKTKSGAYRITGRLKSMIVAENGKKIFPEELEIRIQNTGLVEDCMVYSQPDGNSIIAAVFPTEELRASSDFGETMLVRQIKEINASFPNYKRIGMLVIRKEPFDKTSTKKIKRNSLENTLVKGGVKI